jgi:hypothetical protein
MSTKKKAGVINTQEIVDNYTEYVLEQGGKPSSIFKFCKSIGIQEADFYKHFSSFETLEQAFFVALHEHSLNLLNQSEDFASYTDANKLLSYYFTFFEMATANRSFILLIIGNKGNPLDNYFKLKDLRTHFLIFANNILANNYKLSGEKLQKIETKILQEGAWIQFMLSFKFWMQDSSPNFEKTDILIEKSVKASFEILDALPVQSILDLGKFLWKERPFQ